MAARRLYDAEVALHIARQSGVDKWIGAAGDRLHDAVRAYRATVVRAGPSGGTEACGCVQRQVQYASSDRSSHALLLSPSGGPNDGERQLAC